MMMMYVTAISILNLDAWRLGVDYYSTMLKPVLLDNAHAQIN